MGHGSPRNAVEENEFNRAWMEAGNLLSHPIAILCISDYWETSGTRDTVTEERDDLWFST